MRPFGDHPAIVDMERRISTSSSPMSSGHMRRRRSITAIEARDDV